MYIYAAIQQLTPFPVIITITLIPSNLLSWNQAGDHVGIECTLGGTFGRSSQKVDHQIQVAGGTV